MDKTNDDKIKEIYTDQAGYQSLANTYKDVKKTYPDIKYNDVKRWYHNNVGYNFVKRGYNSFVPNEPLEQVQVDSFFIIIHLMMCINLQLLVLIVLLNMVL